MADEDESKQIEDLVNRFSDAEQSLRKLLIATQQLTGARDELAGAREDMGRTQAESLARLEEARRTIREDLKAADEKAKERLEATVVAVEHRLDETAKTLLTRFDGAERSLESSQKALADTASGVYGLTNELKDIARDMKDAAIALRALNPEKINTRLDELAEKIDTRLDGLGAQQRRAQMLLFVLFALVVIVGIVVAVV